MTQEQPEDALDPLKIRADIAPQVPPRSLSQQTGTRLRWALACSALTVLVSLATPAFLPLDLRSRPSKTNSDEVIIFTDPPGAKLLTSSLNSQGELLGFSGEPLNIRKLFEDKANPSHPRDSTSLFIKKDGYTLVQQTLTPIDLGAGVWPQKQQPILRLSSETPLIFFTDYLANYRPFLFWGVCLGTLFSAGFALALWRHNAQLAKQEKIRQSAKSEDPLTGLSILGYEVLNRMGKGATSYIYKGVWEKDWATIRALRFTRLPEVSTKEIQERRREIGVHQKLDHPNIVKFFEAQAFENTFVMVMELIEGGDLKNLLEHHAPLSPSRALPIFEKIADALDFAHSQGVTHRDLKPANVMLHKDDTPVVIDFGMAADASVAKITQTGNVKGTLAYISPEQLMGSASHVEPKVDQFAFGLMLYEALSGASAYNIEERSMNEVINDRFNPNGVTPLASAAPKTPQDVSDSLMKMIAYDSSERYSTISEGLEALRSAFRISRWDLEKKLVEPTK